MSQFIILNKDNPIRIINVNAEKPFLRIVGLEFPSTNYEESKSHNLIPISIIIEKRNEFDAKWESYPFFDNFSFSNSFKGGIHKMDEVVIDNNDFSYVSLKYINTGKEDIEVKVYFESTNNYVSITDPFKNFEEHISQKDNAKILFSAPFGQGKSTFLDIYFKQKEKNYEVFKVFPVNYSISHNEDVFKYIKAEILFQLFGKNLEFDKETSTYFQSAKELFKRDPAKILSPFIRLIPKVGKDAFEIFEQLNKLKKSLFEEHANAQIDDKAAAEKFIEELYEKEGSIFEDNFFTQLIRQQLKKLQQSTKRKNVLIIEDLDRMDPDHIFRILNVFAAHFDNADLSDGSTNKFGFDKIIVVGDYNNIKNIYSYRYGPYVNFDGYINKYYSIEPFAYNNKSAITSVIKDIRKGAVRGSYHQGLELLDLVLQDLVSTELITLRDLLKLTNRNALNIIEGKKQRLEKRGKEFYNLLLFFNVLYLLNKVFDIDSLISKFETLAQKQFVQGKINYNYYTGLGLASLKISKYEDKGTKEYLHNKTQIRFTFLIQWNPDNNFDFYEVKDVVYIDANTSKPNGNLVQFDANDFHHILLLNAKKYKEVGGFD